MPKEEISPEVVEDDDSEAKEDNKSVAEKEFSDEFKSAAKGEKDSAKGSGDGAKAKADDEDRAGQPGGQGEKEDKGGKVSAKEAPAEDGKGEAKEKVKAAKPGDEETAEERIERVATELKDRREKEAKDKAKAKEQEQEEDERPAKAKAGKEKAEKEQEPETRPKRESKQAEDEDVLAGIDLTDEEREYIDDYGEAVSVTKKILSRHLDRMVEERVDAALGKIVPVIDKELEKQKIDNAVLRSEIYLTEQVPDWRQIVLKRDEKTGEYSKNDEWWDWVEKQPKLWQMLAASEDPADNVEIIKYYKDQKEKGKKDEAKAKQAKDREKFEAIRGNSPESGRAVKDTKAKDFSGSFAEFAG